MPSLIGPVVIAAATLFGGELPAVAEPLTTHRVNVVAMLEQPGAPLKIRVSLTSTPGGAEVLAAWLTNASPQPVALRRAVVTVPWVAETPGRRIAAGATATGRWPPFLISTPGPGRRAPVSGMYLLARGRSRCALAGFVSWRTFWSKLHYEPGRLVITADGEGRRIGPGETVALERVWLAEGTDWAGLLFRYAGAIARELHLAPRPPRRFVGWSTWDYYGRHWTAAEVRGNLAALRRLVPAANLIQIDGGWWPERGDYTRGRADLGRDGMRRLADAIRASGLAAGLHLDGMRAAADSAVVREHPEYFLHDDRGRLVRERHGVNGDHRNVFFDYSNPAACAYMRDVLRRMRRNWGFTYFKIDFLRAGIAEDVRRIAFGAHSRRRLVPFNPGLTSVERFHRAMEAFRAGMGAHAFFLACSTPFGPTFGQVDAIRTGPDIAPRFAAYRSDCEATAANFYLEGRVVQLDPDYEVVRARGDEDATLVNDPGKDGRNLTLGEAGMWTDYVALFGGTKLAGDDLMILRDDRKDLVRFALTQPACSRFVPLDLWQHASTRTDAFQVFLGQGGGRVYLALFNWRGFRQQFVVRGVSAAWLRGEGRYRGEADVKGAPGGALVTIAPRHATIFRMPPETDFDLARRRLRVRTISDHP